MDTFYFMSMCKKGGICANSTFSGWASQLNQNKDKIIIVPRQWINIDYAYVIPFDKCAFIKVLIMIVFCVYVYNDIMSDLKNLRLLSIPIQKIVGFISLKIKCIFIIQWLNL